MRGWTYIVLSNAANGCYTPMTVVMTTMFLCFTALWSAQIGAASFIMFGNAYRANIAALGIKCWAKMFINITHFHANVGTTRQGKTFERKTLESSLTTMAVQCCHENEVKIIRGPTQIGKSRLNKTNIFKKNLSQKIIYCPIRTKIYMLLLITFTLKGVLDMGLTQI